MTSYLLASAGGYSALTVALSLWARSLRRRRGQLWRRVGWLPVVALASAFGSLALLLLGAAGTLGAADAAPTESFGASAVSAMNVTSALLLPAWLGYVVSIVALVVAEVGNLRRGRSDET